jgi:hypothetical protein
MHFQTRAKASAWRQGGAFDAIAMPGGTDMRNEKALTELVEEAVEKGATTVEEIHRSIADLPLTVLERLGLFEETTSEVRKVQDTSIGAIYDLIRNINHKVGTLATDLLQQRKGSGESRE